ncbi:mitochondrial carrier domain-containing protein [Dipodascopsis tothii]|uniref:mitochondrial carrier domain-containing protein n=1 Tax=Dipodascopsis tothii TaxID=44089 RepID=UPI0034CFABEF
MPSASTDFIAGYVSGVVGITIGNPLDIVKVRLQSSSEPARTAAGEAAVPLLSQSRAAAAPPPSYVQRARSMLRGVAAPILGYGALNAVLFSSYSLSLSALDSYFPAAPGVAKIFASGTVAGLSTFAISTPIEVIKCRTQLAGAGAAQSSWAVCKAIWAKDGLRGYFRGGLVTSLRDGFGYGVYFWTYGLGKSLRLHEDESGLEEAVHLLLAGGVAGCASWASIFPLDVIKTRYQVQQLGGGSAYAGPWDCAVKTFAEGGVRIFFRGMKVAMVRAFIVNAAQFGTYEWTVRAIEG